MGSFLSLCQVVWVILLFLWVLQQCFSTVYYRYNLKKLTYEERKASLIQRLNALNSAAGADDDEDEDED